MTKNASAEKRIKKLYLSQDENMYSHRFFEDMFAHYSFDLGERQEREEFFSFEPKGCQAELLLKANCRYGFSHETENTISRAISHMAKCGKAYLYLQPKYEETKNRKGGIDKKEIVSLDLVEMAGYPKKGSGGKTYFYRLTFGEKVNQIEIEPGLLVTLDIKDLGYRKNTFVRMVKKLGKYDILNSVRMSIEHVPGYDYQAHAKKDRINLLKTTKDVGWHFGPDGLSDSYILYRKIQRDKIKTLFLQYVIIQINNSLKAFFAGSNVGEMVLHLKNLDYQELWGNYSKGKITGTELTNTLFKSY